MRRGNDHVVRISNEGLFFLSLGAPEHKYYPGCLGIHQLDHSIREALPPAVPV